LPARLVGEEAHQVERRIACAVALRQHDHRSGADERAVRLQRIEIEGNIAERRRQDASRSAARKIAVELVAGLHAAAIFVDQLAHGDAGRREMARRVSRRGPTPRTSAVPLRPWRPWSANQGAPFSRMSRTQYSVSMLCSSVGLPKSPTLRDIGRTQSGHSALAFDRLDHRRLFAADVRAGAAAQLDSWQRSRRVPLKRLDLTRQDRAARRVFVAQIDVDVGDADRPRRDQHPLEESMRVALEIVTILERARLALVDVDRHQPRLRLAADDLPLAADRETPPRPGRAGSNPPSS
jgi:hypothetical protein